VTIPHDTYISTWARRVAQICPQGSVADKLRAGIAAGRVPPGDQLPPIAKLVDRFGSAKATVERALDVLRGEGLIASRQGSRSVVVAFPEEHDATGRRTHARRVMPRRPKWALDKIRARVGIMLLTWAGGWGSG
jgi:DNA-binding FadR family transcriptional regulator